MINLDSLLDQPMPQGDTKRDYGKHPSGKPWSEYQVAIFDAVSDGHRNVAVQAVAGSAKTTTSVASTKFVPPHEKCAFFAFNKSIAEELKQRVASNCDARTFHSLGMQIINRNSKRPDVFGGKVRKIAKEQLADAVYTDIGDAIIGIVEEAKVSLLDNNSDVGGMSRIVQHGDWDLGNYSLPQVAGLAARLLRISDGNRDVIDFNDMLRFPFIFRWSFPSYDRIFVDECQDLAPIQHRMLASIPSDQIIAVGDRAQAIYAFRGADAESFNTMVKQFNMLELPLSYSYRCAKLIIARAQEFAPHILALPDAPDGEVQEMQMDDLDGLVTNTDPMSGSMIVCRNNAPLFSLGLKFLRARKPFQMRSDFDKRLINFIKKLTRNRNQDISTFRSNLDEWFRVEFERAEAEDRRGRMKSVTDQYDALCALCEAGDLADTSAIISLIQRLFAGMTGPVLSSIHKAKGLEAHTVYILDPTLMPSKFATSESELQQERNLFYVAITRASNRLIYVYP